MELMLLAVVYMCMSKTTYYSQSILNFTRYLKGGWISPAKTAFEHTIEKRKTEYSEVSSL